MTGQPKKPKIFFCARPIAPPWDEGSKNMVYGLAWNLGEYEIILPTYKNPEPFPVPGNVKLLPIYPKAQLMVVSLKQKMAFLWAVLKARAEIYHFFFSPEPVTSRLLRWMRLIKSGVFIQTIPTSLQSFDDYSKSLFGDWIVVQSQHTRQKLFDSGRRDALCIYPGIDFHRLPFGQLAEALKKKSGLDPEALVVLYPGNYYLGCNEDLIDLVRKYKVSQLKITFVFACRITREDDRKLKAEIEEALEEEIASGLLVLRDTVDPMLALISSADIVIFPPRRMIKKSEIPLALLESLALGKPIVITDIPPLNEIMKWDVGETVPSGNSEALANALDKLIDDPYLRKSKGKRGKQMVLEEFEIRQVARSYAELYRKALKGHSTKR